MRSDDFEFELPPELIAQAPAPIRDQSRLLVLNRETEKLAHKIFYELSDFISPGDVLVLNNSRVIPARLRGSNLKTGGKFEVLLLEENSLNDWSAMLRPAKRARLGTKIIFRDANGKQTAITAEVTEINSEGHRRLRFSGVHNLSSELEKIGEPPLPPYIRRLSNNSEGRIPRIPDSLSSEGRLPNSFQESGTRNTYSSASDDRERYQTVFAKPAGSVAAPTAGLHFSESLLEKIRSRGTKICFVTLHVGLGTFLPVKTENLSDHVMHDERFEISNTTAECINDAKRNGHRIFAVGTTSVRVLESVAAQNEGRIVGARGRTRIFIYPPYDFKIVDALVTNFHLPRSTLLMLVSAFAAPGTSHGREMILSAYAEAIRERYRFFSYGDAMLIL